MALTTRKNVVTNGLLVVLDALHIEEWPTFQHPPPPRAVTRGCVK